MFFKRTHSCPGHESSAAATGVGGTAGTPRRLPITIIVLATALAVAAAVLVWLGSQRLIVALAGGTAYAPEDAEWLLSPRARKLVDAAYTGLTDDAVVQDYWVHALSLGQRAAGEAVNRSFVNPDWLSWWRPLQRLRAGVVLTASGVTDISHADDQYLARLLRLARALPSAHQLHLVALDQRYSMDGRPLPRASVMAVDSGYVWSVAQAHFELLAPVISVHPYRLDAAEALARWAERGVHAVAWMPMLQDIDPAADRLTDYYQALAEHDMTLFTRVGAPTPFAQASPEYGNPMRYRAALEAGVNVVMVQVSGGQRYPAAEGHGSATATQLLLHLLRNPAFDDNLYVALAGVAGADRAEGSLTAWLRHPQVGGQLVYASGYPRPAVATVVDLAELAEMGFLTDEQAHALREIRAVNPLLFDFVLMRTIRLPYTDLGLPSAMFTRDDLFAASG